MSVDVYADHKHAIGFGRDRKWLHFYLGCGMEDGCTVWAVNIGPLYLGWEA
jgi:hypothetical protein